MLQTNPCILWTAWLHVKMHIAAQGHIIRTVLGTTSARVEEYQMQTSTVAFQKLVEGYYSCQVEHYEQE